MDLNTRDIDIFEKWKFITHFRVIWLFIHKLMTYGYVIEEPTQTRKNVYIFSTFSRDAYLDTTHL